MISASECGSASLPGARLWIKALAAFCLFQSSEGKSCNEVLSILFLFFYAWNGPIWKLNATEFGHMDLSDDARLSPPVLMCPGQGEEEERIKYRGSLVVAIHAFLDGVYGKRGGEMNLRQVLEEGDGLTVHTTREQRNTPPDSSQGPRRYQEEEEEEEEDILDEEGERKGERKGEAISLLPLEPNCHRTTESSSSSPPPSSSPLKFY